MLPGCHGFEVLKQIRRRQDVPVVMLTARGGAVLPRNGALSGLAIGFRLRAG